MAGEAAWSTALIADVHRRLQARSERTFATVCPADMRDDRPVLYLMRHGESEWNVERRLQGQTRYPALTATGRVQAGRGAGAIADDLAVAGQAEVAVFTSDLLRAVQTAEIVGARLGATPVRDERLREQGLGSLEGLLSADAYASLGDIDWTDADLRIGGGESAREVYDRMAAALTGMQIDGRATVVVSHGDAIRFALGWLAGRGPHECEWYDVGSGAVVAVGEGGANRWL